MGGLGKTELAIQYAREHLNDYRGGVCWTSASQFPSDLVAFALTHFFPQNFSFDSLDIKRQVDQCWRKWSEGNALIVIDDLTDYAKQVKPYFPEDCRFKFLITTRERLGDPIVPLYLDVLNPEAALDLLKCLVGAERVNAELEVAKKLCEWLGYLPLGLELVGRYLAIDEDLLIEEIQEQLEEEHLKSEALTETEPQMTAEFGVMAAFELSWKRLNEDARIIGQLLSLVPHSPIPWSLVEAIARSKFTKNSEKARRDLYQLNLIKRKEKKTYQLHPLIRDFLGGKLKESPQREEDFKKSFYQAMITVQLQGKEDIYVLNSFSNLAIACSVQGDNKEAQLLCQRALEIADELPDNQGKQKTVNDYVGLITMLAQLEYDRLSSQLVDYDEVVSIGALAVHVLLTSNPKAKYKHKYLAAAFQWAIRNELRVRYGLYSRPDENRHS